MNKKHRVLILCGILSIILFGIFHTSLATQLNPEAKRNTNPTHREPFKIRSPTSASPEDFITVWNTQYTSEGSSAADQIRLPFESEGTYECVVNWGDGQSDSITLWNQAETTHTYSEAGEYTVTMTGTLFGWQFGNKGDPLKIIEIVQWGEMGLGNEGYYFHGCANLKLTATDAPDLSKTKTLTQAFRGCENLGVSGYMNSWDVSQVTDMSGMFWYAHSFNQDIRDWDVSHVTTMGLMFAKADMFNQDIGNWDVSHVTSMGNMFYCAGMFNQDIGNWNVSHVNSMGWMFVSAYNFNQDISGWDVSQVFSMTWMFASTNTFNQDIGNWDVSNVEYMDWMFANTETFNQDIGNWDVSNVKDMEYMFYEANAFDQDIGGWDVSSVTTMTGMFTNTTLSTENYDALLNGWSRLSLQSGVTFDGGDSTYSDASAKARKHIIDDFQWTINDQGNIDTFFIPGVLIAGGIGIVGFMGFGVYVNSKRKH